MATRPEQRENDLRWHELERELATALTQPEPVAVVIVVSDQADAHQLWRLLTHAERGRVAIQWVQVHVLSGHPYLAGVTQPPPPDPVEDVIRRDLTYD